MRLILKTAPFKSPLFDAGGDIVTAAQIRGAFAEQLGFDPETELVVPYKTLPVAVDITLTDEAVPFVTLIIEIGGADDLAYFRQGMMALKEVRHRLALAAERVNPGWQQRDEYERICKVSDPLDGLLGTQRELDDDRASMFGVTLSVPDAVFDLLGPEKYASVALAAQANPGDLKKGLTLKTDRRELTVTIEAGSRFNQVRQSEFVQTVTSFLHDCLPGRPPQPHGRLVPISGIATLAPSATRQRPWALRVSAALLVTLAGLSWLVRIDTSWLIVGWVWWTTAVVVAVLMGRDLKGSLASVAGAASTFLGLMVFFGLVYGVIQNAGTHEIGLAWISKTGSPRLGEMFLLSLGLAVSAGTTDVMLEGLARFVAFVELLFFFGTVAGVIGALGRRWLFDREVRITGEAPFPGLEDDEGR
jgi:hypothetical protein